MTFSDWVSLSSPVCWIATFVAAIYYALRKNREADAEPGRKPWLEFDEGKAERGYEAMRRAEEAEHVAEIARHQAKMARLLHDLKHGFPDEQHVLYDEKTGGLVLPFGSMSNPLRLVRVLDRSLDDTATWARVEDFAPVVLVDE